VIFPSWIGSIEFPIKPSGLSLQLVEICILVGRCNLFVVIQADTSLTKLWYTILEEDLCGSFTWPGGEDRDNLPVRTTDQVIHSIFLRTPIMYILWQYPTWLHRILHIMWAKPNLVIYFPEGYKILYWIIYNICNV
jgi:hypothetical protein